MGQLVKINGLLKMKKCEWKLDLGRGKDWKIKIINIFI